MSAATGSSVSSEAPDGLAWRNGDGPAAQRHNSHVMKTISGWVRDGAREKTVALLSNWPPEDVLDCVAHIRTRDAMLLMEWLPDAVGIAVLAELNPEYRRVLFKPSTQVKFAKLMSRLPATDARRLMMELPTEFAEALVVGREDAESLLAVLRHGPDAAATVMQHRSLIIPQDWTLGELIEDIRSRQDEIERIEALLVVDSAGAPVGYLRVRDLLFHPKDAYVRDVMRTDILAVAPETDREDVLALAKREHQHILAVVDPSNRLVGAIAPSELAEIERLEAREDLLRSGGVPPDSSLFDSPIEIVRKRAPWLLIGLVGALLAAFVIAGYEETLAEAAILASFIPVIMATAGNVGIQASTVSIQALTTEADESDAILARLGREIVGSLLNGAIVGGATACVVAVAAPLVGVEDTWALAATAFFSLLIVIVITGCVGAIVPILLDRLGLDPSVSTGIFIVTSADVFGVLAFFVVAQLLYL
ncbi:MAG: magnesium transporter [Rhodobacteraceae bacterium]|nr:magnesium transporter [Paracoccaceae bacterium]